MDIPRLRYSRHARKHLVKYHIDEDDIAAIVWYPSRRYMTHRGVEHEGWLSDGRPIRVVTDHTEQYVITIVDPERRNRLRRYSR
jgi:hypothetical protein